MTVAQVKEYLLRSWAGARSKPYAKTFDQLHLKVHISVSAHNAIIKMPPHRLLYVNISPEYYIVFQGS